MVAFASPRDFGQHRRVAPERVVARAQGPLTPNDPTSDLAISENLDHLRRTRRAVGPCCGVPSYAAIAARSVPVRVRCATCGEESLLEQWVVA